MELTGHYCIISSVGDGSSGHSTNSSDSCVESHGGGSVDNHGGSGNDTGSSVDSHVEVTVVLW